MITLLQLFPQEHNSVGRFYGIVFMAMVVASGRAWPVGHRNQSWELLGTSSTRSGHQWAEWRGSFHCWTHGPGRTSQTDHRSSWMLDSRAFPDKAEWKMENEWCKSERYVTPYLHLDPLNLGIESEDSPLGHVKHEVGILKRVSGIGQHHASACREEQRTVNFLNRCYQFRSKSDKSDHWPTVGVFSLNSLSMCIAIQHHPTQTTSWTVAAFTLLRTTKTYTYVKSHDHAHNLKGQCVLLLIVAIVLWENAISI